MSLLRRILSSRANRARSRRMRCDTVCSFDSSGSIVNPAGSAPGAPPARRRRRGRQDRGNGRFLRARAATFAIETRVLDDRVAAQPTHADGDKTPCAPLRCETNPVPIATTRERIRGRPQRPSRNLQPIRKVGASPSFSGLVRRRASRGHTRRYTEFLQKRCCLVDLS
jgi:hypothetical protein